MDVDKPKASSPGPAPAPSPVSAQSSTQGLMSTPPPAKAAMDAFGHYTDKPAKKSKFEPHEHGAKKKEQERLTEDFGHKVSGKTHESEHTIGYEPLAQTGNLKRGGSPRARDLENHAPAYQESAPMHRAHIGTGTTNQRDGSGLNSHEYRGAQRSLLESGDVSSSVQMNQLGYAHNPDFQAEKGWQADAADSSYGHMVTGMNNVSYASGKGEKSASVSPMQQVEMLAARGAARTGQWPNRDDLKNAWAQLGYHEDD